MIRYIVVFGVTFTLVFITVILHSYPLIFCEYFPTVLENPRDCYAKSAITKENPTACTWAAYAKPCFDDVIASYSDPSECERLRNFTYNEGEDAADACLKRFATRTDTPSLCHKIVDTNLSTECSEAVTDAGSATASS